MENRITHAMIKSMVKKALKDAKEAPERSVRNLVDLGLNFSTGKYQQRFLEVTREMLQDESSAYYRMIRDTVADIDSETLITFGMNIGYNSCTMGARTIRRMEEKEHLNIPWFLSFSIESSVYPVCARQYYSLIDQGMELGIYTYAIFSESFSPEIFSMFEKYSKCAFILFCSAEDISDEFLEQANRLHNLCTVVKESPDSPSVCRTLRQNGLLHGVYTSYSEDSAPDILNGRFLNCTEEYKPPFVFFVPAPSCPEHTQDEIYKYVLNCRQGQEYPSVVMDAMHDGLLVDEIISGNPVLILFLSNGTVITSRDPDPKACDNMTLRELLKKYLPAPLPPGQ